MKWLTPELIQTQLRIDAEQYQAEEAVFELYAESAEDTVLDWIERPIEDLYEEYGKIPAKLIQASLLLVTLSYEQRSPITRQQMYIVPYGNFDALCSAYLK